jgi:hypothetical protein
VLLGKQRFEHAAGFFLLAGRLKDAIEVCIRSLNDLQLALVIIRLYESDYDKMSNYIKSILFAEVLGYTLTPEQSGTVKKSDSFGKLSETPKAENVSSDTFLRSMSYWHVKDYRAALNTLYDIDLDTDKATKAHGNARDSVATVKNESTISHVFNFYTFLKQHPLLLRQQLVEDTKNSVSNNNSASLTPIERRLHFVSAYFHLINGCPLLTLDILSKLPKYISTSVAETATEDKVESAIESKPFDFTDNAPPKKVEKAEEFDWSTPSYGLSSKRFEEEELDLGMSSSDEDEEDAEKTIIDEQKPETEQKQSNLSDDVKLQNKQSSIVNRKDSVEIDGADRLVDTFAQQIKFISCLKILIEEMSTLSTGFEVVGGQLRYYMYYWLERETQVLRELGDYGNAYDSSLPLSYEGTDETLSLADDGSVFSANDAEQDSSSSVMLHEQLYRDEKLFQSKVQRLNKRKEWLRSNELLLRTFLCYCSLHSANGAGLSSVKMELVLLMQELVEDRSMKQLFSPIPVPTTIPLLAASIASSKNIVAGPIQMIKNLATDILSSIVDIDKIPLIFDYSILIATIKDASVSLSSCIYQCLCDSDSLTVSDNSVNTGMQGFSRLVLTFKYFISAKVI